MSPSIAVRRRSRPGRRPPLRPRRLRRCPRGPPAWAAW